MGVADADHEHRIGELERWRHQVTLDMGVMKGELEQNTRATTEARDAARDAKNVSDKVSGDTEVIRNILTAGRVNAKIFAWLGAIGIGGSSITALVVWLKSHVSIG